MLLLAEALTESRAHAAGLLRTGSTAEFTGERSPEVDSRSSCDLLEERQEVAYKQQRAKLSQHASVPCKRGNTRGARPACRNRWPSSSEALSQLGNLDARSPEEADELAVELKTYG